MKHQVRAKSEREMLASFPIRGPLDGWFFRVTERSVGAFLAEGSDRWGRLISTTASDAELALEKCIEDARRITKGLTRGGDQSREV